MSGYPDARAHGARWAREMEQEFDERLCEKTLQLYTQEAL
jgi:hypothetical protein